jgi:hypothetical protein
MSNPKLPPAVMAYFAKEGRKGGKKGGPARAAALSPERRSEISAKAAVARWAKKAKD